jgi:iron complex transport system permease protein
VVFNAFASAIILAIQSLVSPGMLQSLLAWLLGSIGHVPPRTLLLAGGAVLAGTIVLVRRAPALNLLSLGELDAHGLGLDVPRTRMVVFGVSAVLVAAAVSLAGVIGFVGLIVPHLVRLAFGADHRIVVPGSVLGGAAFLALSDCGARLFFRVAHTLPPVGMVTALIGAPLFLHLLVARTRRSER